MFNKLSELKACFADRSQIEGLAVDSEHQKLYYTDYRWERVCEVSTDGSNHRILITVRGSKPRAIVLDSVNRFVFVNYWCSVPHLRVTSNRTQQLSIFFTLYQQRFVCFTIKLCSKPISTCKKFHIRNLLLIDENKRVKGQGHDNYWL